MKPFSKYIIIFTSIIFVSFFIYLGNFFLKIHHNEKKLEKAQQVDDKYWDNLYINYHPKKNYKLAILTTNGGEWSYAHYLKKAAEKLGWELQVFFNSFQGYEKELLKYDPDIIILSYLVDLNFSDELSYHRSKKYGQFFFHIDPRANWNQSYGIKKMFKPDMTPGIRLQQLIDKTDGLLITAKEISIFQEYYKKTSKDFHALRIFPTINNTSLIDKPAIPKRIFYMLRNLISENKKDNVLNFLTKLSNSKIIDYYGSSGISLYSKIPYFKHQHKGLSKDIITDIRNSGIYLLVHSSEHVKYKIPSARIFEAVASNVIVISDKNQFVIDNFGDNILYYDQDSSPEVINNQINNHLNWIKQNPEKAMEKANNAYKIFLEKFTAENDLIRIAKMHEYILDQNNN